MIGKERLLGRLNEAKRESRYLEFKREFDIASPAAWIEVIKDIVAIANSGGGAILFGVENNGTTYQNDLGQIRSLDIADITNRIHRYTGYQFADVDVVDVARPDGMCVAFVIEATDIPMVFTRPGTYDAGGGKQRTAFSVGTVYFRHGGKSEPGNRDDLVEWREREIARVKESWLGGIRKVVDAPEGHTVAVIPAVAASSSGLPIPVRAQVSTDADAVKMVPYNAEELWPHRQKELLAQVNGNLKGQFQLNGHDITCINRVFAVMQTHPEFAYKPHRLASPQYSLSFANWIVEQCQKDPLFLVKTREQYRSAASASSRT